MNEGVDLRRLHVLRMVAEHGTVTAAAGALHLSPSAVSHQLRQLANELGVTLVEANGRGIRLTTAGRRVVAHADTLHAAWEQARADLADLTDGEAGLLRMCGYPTGVAGLLAPAAERLRDRWPDVTIEITEIETAEGFDLLLAGETDVAVVVPDPDSPPQDDGRFLQHPLYAEALDLLVPASHPLATRSEPVDLAEAANEPWIVPDAARCDFAPIVRAACASAGFTPRAAHSVHTNVAIAGMVARGHGVALLPRLSPLASDDDLVRVPLAGDPPPSRRLITAVRRGSDGQPLIARGLDAIREVADEHAGQLSLAPA